MAKATTNQVMQTAGSIILPLALAQFICTYAGTSMNVAISNIAADLNTTVAGVQVAITLFTLVMAALMIPGSILTDIWGRKFCLVLGLAIYAVGALIAAASPNLTILIFGNSILEGVGSALLIPPVYILVTVFFTDLTARAKNYGIISAAAGIAAAAGPLIGGLITSAISWRAELCCPALVIGLIVLLARKINDPKPTGAKPKLDIEGAILSAAGLIFIVVGILMASTYGWFEAKQDFMLFGVTIIKQGNLSPVWLFMAIGAGFLYWFYYHISKFERTGKKPLISPKLFANKTSNAGLITQIVQWLTQGSFFAMSVFLQSVKGLNAIETGVALTPATIGILVSSALSGRLAKRQSQALLIRRGFLVTMIGMILLLLFGNGAASVWAFAPGLLIMGLGVGVMLTSSVNVVQSSFSEKDQGEISGLSRSVSNLGSSLGVAMVGSVLASTLVVGTQHYLLAILVILVADAIGLLAAFRIPKVIQAAPDN